MKSQAGSLRVLFLPNTVLFPHSVLPFTVRNPVSVQLINSLGDEKTIVVIGQRDPQIEFPRPADLFAVGTLATVHRVVKMPDKSSFIFTEGLERVLMTGFDQLSPYIQGTCEPLPDISPPNGAETAALMQDILAPFEQIVKESPTLSDELAVVAGNIGEPGRLADFIASTLPTLLTADKQDILETTDVRVRIQKVKRIMMEERENQKIRNEIHSLVRDRIQNKERQAHLREMLAAIGQELLGMTNDSSSPQGQVERGRRERYLREQLSAIQSELTGRDDESISLQELDDKRLTSLRKAIFIVHGHDHSLLTDLELALRRWGLEPVVLSEQANRGMTLIEKLEANTAVAFAFILLTRDDVGGKDMSALQARARQNVIWEWGYLVGRLGRGRVCCLYHEGVEIPSDLRGTATIIIRGELKNHLEEIRREIKQAGFSMQA
jgi:Lon protease-like protein